MDSMAGVPRTAIAAEYPASTGRSTSSSGRPSIWVAVAKASALIHAGCSVKQVQAALGHKSAKVTVDVYGHLWPGEEDRVRNAIGRLFRPDALHVAGT